MTLAYEPGGTIAHRLDPRSKLGVQIAFAVAAFAHTTPRGLLVLTALGGVLLAVARLPLRRALWELRFAVVLVSLPVLIEGLVWDTPPFSIAEAREPALASYRVLLIVLVSTTYVRSTPIRDSEAAIRWAIPGKAGRLLATGVALVFRFLPVLRADLAAIRQAMAARLGTERPLIDRMELIAVGGLQRAFGRADRLALAMNARCFAWNPTLPDLGFSRVDLLAFCLIGVLLTWTVL
ncbi:cobalt ABC transporter permease [Halobacteriales archaeon QS_3_64_16]|nr:MAG: cobalt ABC transporter permease [Halobacteriales archaeon QS_3_64_16]